MAAISGIVFALCVGYAIGRSNGPPAVEPTCLNLMPAPAPLSPHVMQDGNGTYDLTVMNLNMSSTPGYFYYKAGTVYTGVFLKH